MIKRGVFFSVILIGFLFSIAGAADCPKDGEDAKLPSSVFLYSDRPDETYFWLGAGKSIQGTSATAPAGACAVQFEGRTYFTREEALTRTLGHQPPDLQSCPSDSVRASPNYAVTAAEIKYCPIPKLNFITRKNIAPTPDCVAPSASSNDDPSVWLSCPPPGVCTPDQQAIVDKWNDLSVQLSVARCRAHPIDDAKIDDLKAQANALSPPSCLERFKDPPNKIVIHSTDFGDTDGPDVIENNHLSRKFSDVGYHFIIAQDPKTGEWKTYEGRSLEIRGAHAGAGLNDDSVAIAIAGSDAPDVQMSSGSLGQLRALIAKLRADNPNLSHVYGHGEYKQSKATCTYDCKDVCVTACPSPAGQNIVNTFNDSLFASPTAPVTPASGVH